jgi:hypothetical protein
MVTDRHLIADDLRDGFGSEDIAKRTGQNLADIRHQVQEWRSEGKLTDILAIGAWALDEL